MGMPITVKVVDADVSEADIEDVYNYFQYIDTTFSTYKNNSEISRINQKVLPVNRASNDVKTVLKLCEETKKITDGYFDMSRNGMIDPSGLVKGWSILNAAKLLEKKGFKNYYVDAGGDIQVRGKNKNDQPWSIGIRNPFNRYQVIKIIHLENGGVATSGLYIRGAHIFNPHDISDNLQEIVSFTVVGPNVYEADRFATAAFAMQRKGIFFIENLKGFEGYMIDKKGIATYTSNFNTYVQTS